MQIYKDFRFNTFSVNLHDLLTISITKLTNYFSKRFSASFDFGFDSARYADEHNCSRYEDKFKTFAYLNLNDTGEEWVAKIKRVINERHENILPSRGDVITSRILTRDAKHLELGCCCIIDHDNFNSTDLVTAAISKPLLHNFCHETTDGHDLRIVEIEFNLLSLGFFYFIIGSDPENNDITIAHSSFNFA